MEVFIPMKRGCSNNLLNKFACVEANLIVLESTTLTKYYPVEIPTNPDPELASLPNSR